MNQMTEEINEIFKTSVKEAVQSSLQSGKPLFVFLSNNDSTSGEFIKKFLYKDEEILTEAIEDIKTKFVGLKLMENSDDIEYFRQIFKNVVLPSFFIIRGGQIMDIITKDSNPQKFLETLKNISLSGASAQDFNSTTTNDTNLSETGPVSSQMPQVTHQVSDNGSVHASSTNEHSIKKRESGHSEAVVAENQKKLKAFNKSLNEETDRIRALLKADQKERESKKREALLYKSETARQTDSRVSPIRHDVCVLSIKLFDGNSLKHEFKPDQTLNDVRNWLEEQTNGEIISKTTSMPSFATASYPQPTRYAFHRPSLPRMTYTDEQEFSQLSKLQLCPRSVLILKPIYDDKGFSSSYPNGKKSNEGMLRSIGSTLGKVGNALYSFFDYGVDDDSHLHREDEEIERQASPISDESSGVSSGHTNFPNNFGRNDDYFQAGDRTNGTTTPNIVSIDVPRTSSASLINFHRQNTISSQDSTNITDQQIGSTFSSRASSPKPPGIPLRGVQDIQGESKDEKTSKDPNRDFDTYNGNSVDLKDNKSDT